MDQAGEATGVGKPSGGSGAGVRTGQSGEGARSALEQLIQQEKKRDAQRPREGGPAAPGPGR